MKETTVDSIHFLNLRYLKYSFHILVLACLSLLLKSYLAQHFSFTRYYCLLLKGMENLNYIDMIFLCQKYYLGILKTVDSAGGLLDQIGGSKTREKGA